MTASIDIIDFGSMLISLTAQCTTTRARHRRAGARPDMLKSIATALDDIEAGDAMSMSTSRCTPADGANYVTLYADSSTNA